MMLSLVRIIYYTIVAYHVQLLLEYAMLYDGRDGISHFVGICYYSLLGLLICLLGYDTSLLGYNGSTYWDMSHFVEYIYGYILLIYDAKTYWNILHFAGI